MHRGGGRPTPRARPRAAARRRRPDTGRPARPGPERPTRRSRAHGGAGGRPSNRRGRVLAQPVARARPRLESEAAGRYAALSLLGPGYRFHTEVVGSGTLVGDVWHGDLWLRGFGDPTLEPSDLGGTRRRRRLLGHPPRRRAVIGDESWFDARRVAPGWRPSFYIGESPPLSALVVDRGRYRGRTSPNPALAAASLFRQALEATGVRVAGAAEAAYSRPLACRSRATSPSRSPTSSGSWAARATTTRPRCS